MVLINLTKYKLHSHTTKLATLVLATICIATHCLMDMMEDLGKIGNLDGWDTALNWCRYHNKHVLHVHNPPVV